MLTRWTNIYINMLQMFNTDDNTCEHENGRQAITNRYSHRPLILDDGGMVPVFHSSRRRFRIASENPVSVQRESRSYFYRSTVNDRIRI